jgi:hypothetical protein
MPIKFDEKKTIADIQRAQAANQRAIAQLRPGGALGRMVLYITQALHRQAVVDTHVDTGTLRAAHRMLFSEDEHAARGEIFIDPSAVNPRSQQRAEIYGVYEHARGGSHAFYQRAVDEAGPKAVEDAMRLFGAAIDAASQSTP